MLLLDPLVCAREQSGWQCQGLGRFEIEEQLELRRLHYRQVCRLRTLENFIDVVNGPTPDIVEARTLGHEPTKKRELLEFVGSDDGMLPYKSIIRVGSEKVT